MLGVLAVVSEQANLVKCVWGKHTCVLLLLKSSVLALPFF